MRRFLLLPLPLRRCLSGLLAGLAVACCAATSAMAGTLTVESTSIPGLTAKSAIVTNTLRFTGLIEVPDADKLRAELAKIRAKTQPGDGPMATIEFSSKGGDLLEGIKIGYLLREFDVATLVREGDLCLSACALAFLGGTQSRQPPAAIPSRRIAIGGKVGFHNFTINVGHVQAETRNDAAAGISRSFDLARAGAARMMRFVTDMGVEPAFIAELVGLAPEAWQYVDTAGGFLETGSCPIGNLPAPGRLEAQAVNVCSNATGWLTTLDASQAQRHSLPQAQRHLLEHVRANIAAFNIKGPLAAQLAAVIASSDNRLVEAVYGDLRAAGITLPDIKGAHFEILVEARDGYRLQCHVSLAPNELDTFDLVLVTNTGFSRPFRTPPPGCPGLFRYNRDDMINPARG